MILFDFYSTRNKVYIHLSCIIAQQKTLSQFESTLVLSSCNLRTSIMYQGSDVHCNRDHNSFLICLLQPYLKFVSCNISVLVIVPNLNILVWSIKMFFLILRNVLAIFISWQRLWFYNFRSSPDLHLWDLHCHKRVHYIVTTKILYYLLFCFVWFFIIFFDSLYSFTLQ